MSTGLSIMISETFRDFSEFLQENSGIVLPRLGQIPSNLVVTSHRAIERYIWNNTPKYVNLWGKI